MAFELIHRGENYGAGPGPELRVADWAVSARGGFLLVPSACITPLELDRGSLVTMVPCLPRGTGSQTERSGIFT